MSTLFARTDQSIVGHWWWTVDRLLLASIAVLVLCGVMLIATASPPVAERIGLGGYHFIKRHLVLLGPSLCLMLGISLLNPRMIWRLSSLMFLGSIGAMVLVLFVGIEVKGAQRWLHLPGFSLQPSEFVKPAFAIVAAWFIAQQQEKPDFPGYKIAAGLFALVLLLLMLQPDFGMTVVTCFIFGAQIFLAGFSLPIMFALGGLAIAGGGLVYLTFSHVRSRIDRFLDPQAGDNYQVDKALEAFKEGGIFGVGPGQGTVKLEIPDSHADFIFAVGGEEMGLMFVGFLIMLFGFIVVRGFNRVIDSEDMFIVLSVGGLLVMFGLQALIHMGANVSLLPAKGMTLPFISYGGSSLLAMGYTMGVVLALTRRYVRPSIAGQKRKRKSK